MNANSRKEFLTRTLTMGIAELQTHMATILNLAQNMTVKELKPYMVALKIPGFIPTYKSIQGHQNWKSKTVLLEELGSYLRTGAIPMQAIDDTDKDKPCEDTLKKLKSGATYMVKYKPQRIVKGRKWVCEEDREATNSQRNTVDYRKKKYSVPVLQAIKSRYGLETLDEAAKKHDQLREAVYAGRNGWGINVSTPALSKSFFIARNKGHNAVSIQEMQKVLNANGNSRSLQENLNFNKNVAGRAYLTAAEGWDSTGSKFTFLKNGQKKRVDREFVNRVRERLQQLHPLKKRPSEILAIEAIKRGTVGLYDVMRDEALVGQKRIKGHEVAKYMNRIKNEFEAGNNSNSNDEPVNLAEYEIDPVVLDDLLARQYTDQTIEAARSMESSRRAADNALLGNTRTLTPMQFSRVILQAMSFTGPLETRPLLFGNFGKSNELNTSVIDQIGKQIARGTKTGCADERQRKPWLVASNTSTSKVPLGMSLTPAQAVILAATTLRARGILAPAPGMLAWHSLGSGKTLATVCAIVGFWNTEWCIAPVSVRTNSRSNDIGRLAALAAEFFPYFRSTFEIPQTNQKQEMLEHQYPFAFGQKHALKHLRRRLQRGREIQYGEEKKLDDSSLVGSFVTVIRDFVGGGDRKSKRYLQDNEKVKNTVFIVDEAHMLFSPPTSEKSFEKDYENFRTLLTYRRSSSTYVVALTATPGESTDQVEGLLDMVAGRDLPKTTDGLQKAVADLGLVSFAYLSADRNTFAKPYVSKECLPLDTRTTFTKYYLMQLSKLQETQNNVYNRFPDNFEERKKREPRKALDTQISYDPKSKNAFWNRVRMLSEYIQVSQSSTLHNKFDDLNSNLNEEDVEDGFDQNMEAFSKGSDYDSLYEDGQKGTPLETGTVLARWKVSRDEYRYNVFLLSPKIIQCVKNILANPGEVHFVYVNSWKTLRLVAFVLECLEYERYTARDAMTPGKRYGIINVQRVVPKREYCTGGDHWSQQRANMASAVKALLGFNVNGEFKGGALTNSNNARGQICQVVLATGDNYKGVDVGHVRHVHCISMFADFVDLMQLQGRGPRNCSHRALELSERTCVFHMYSLHNDNWSLKLQPDRYLLKEAMSRAKDLITLDAALQNNAVDFKVFGQWNESRVELIKQLKGNDCITSGPPKRRVSAPKKPSSKPMTEANIALQRFNKARVSYNKTRKERLARALLRRAGIHTSRPSESPQPFSRKSPPVVVRPSPTPSVSVRPSPGPLRLSATRPSPMPSRKPSPMPTSVRPSPMPTSVRPSPRPTSVRPSPRPTSVRPSPRPSPTPSMMWSPSPRPSSTPSSRGVPMEFFKAMSADDLRKYMKETIPGFVPTFRSEKGHRNWKTKAMLLAEIASMNPNAF